MLPRRVDNLLEARKKLLLEAFYLHSNFNALNLLRVAISSGGLKVLVRFLSFNLFL